MDVSLFIARRLSFRGRIAMVSIAVSFIVMIISVSISSGFRSGIRDGISFMSGDVQLTPVNLNYLDESSPIRRYPSYIGRIDSLPGVLNIRPAVYRAGIIKEGETIQGVIFKGVETGPVGDSLGTMSVSVPSRLSDMLGLDAGNSFQAYFIGDKVRARKFTVSSVYDGILDSDENMLVYASLSDMQRLNGWTSDDVSALEISVSPSLRNVRGLEMMETEIGSIALMYAADDDPTVVASSSVSRYPQMFDWLNLIDFNVFFILALMTVVAGFNMISGLLIMLFENISTIGLLKSLGMDNRKIAKIFLAVSSKAVFRGMVWGNAIAAGLCLLQKYTHAIKLDPSNYFLSYVPVDLNPVLIISADIAAYAVIMLLLLIPSLFITSVDPARTVRMN